MNRVATGSPLDSAFSQQLQPGEGAWGSPMGRVQTIESTASSGAGRGVEVELAHSRIEHVVLVGMAVAGRIGPATRA